MLYFLVVWVLKSLGAKKNYMSVATKKNSAESNEGSSGVAKQPAHLVKVQKFINNLPQMSEEATTVFNTAKTLSTTDINVLVAHLTAETRIRGVNASSSTSGKVDLKVGDAVQVVSGNQTKFIGKTGTLTRVQRIRCYAKFDEYEKEGYFFLSDVELVSRPASIVNNAPETEIVDEEQGETLVDLTESSEESLVSSGVDTDGNDVEESSELATGTDG